ncbi:hypothetical protein RvY_11839 [Ramazzottius varieornatus]|uniref:DUF659 domain-containing protein n=1 Tax=Ramazzottius varieornatus TaxID=947166 RepID=A0A1D1VHG4_RAMVA|nr:hypothetical protein RvY_11839 [Ramazzottius varieornatus]
MSKKETTRHTNNFTEWIVCTAEPIGTVDEPHFVKMINGLNPSYKVPCRQTIRKLILDGYKMKKMQIIEELAAVTSRFSLTTDMWQASARKQSYLAITLQWIDNEWKLRNVILDFRYMPKNHSGENMKNVVMETLQEFKVAHRIFGVTTDGALNMVKFFELLVMEMGVEKPNTFWNCCAAHIVNKVAEVAIKKEVVTVDKIRACVIYMRRPTIREIFLATIKPATEDLKLPLDVSTRWNSFLHMVESAYPRRHELYDYLSAQEGAIRDEVPSAEEWIDMEDLIELLKPLKAVSALWICELAKDMLVKLDECLRLSWEKPGVRMQVPMIARLLDPSIKDAYLPSAKSRTAAGTMLKHIV